MSLLVTVEAHIAYIRRELTRHTFTKKPRRKDLMRKQLKKLLREREFWKKAQT